MTSETAAAPLLDLDHVDLLTLLQALSDPVRLEIVRQLAACPCPGEMACGQIRLPVSKSTVTHHMRVLADAGVVSEREAGTRKFMALRREELDERFPGVLDAVIRSAGAPHAAAAV
jgi:DNA-binding transcriptional ArsR family regulator